MSSDLQAAGGKTIRAKYFDGDGVHLNECSVANMLRSIVAHIRQPATKAKDSLPQDKKAHPITVQLSRRSGRVTPGTLSSSVVEGVGAGSTEKRRDADDTLERVQCTVHAIDGERQQQRHKAVDGLPRQLPIIRPSPTLPSTTLSSPAIPSSNVPSSTIPISAIPSPSPPPPPPRPLTPYRRGAADVPPVPVSPDQPWWSYRSVMHCDYPWGQLDNARHSPYQNRVSNGL